MALDSTARKANFYYSLKKYIIDNIVRVEGVHAIFDRFLPPDDSVDRWLSVTTGNLDRDTLSRYEFDIYCVTRKDLEGDRLSVLSDLVTGYFLGDTTKLDTLVRVPFYDAVTKQQNGSMVIYECKESDSSEAPDLSKFLILSITAKMATKI